MDRRKVLLFTGLILFTFSAFSYWTEQPLFLIYLLLGGGIFCKSLFLFYTFRSPDFRMSPGMYIILSGVGLILLSLLFKKAYPVPLLRNFLFYTAITLKITGVALLFYKPGK